MNCSFTGLVVLEEKVQRTRKFYFLTFFFVVGFGEHSHFPKNTRYRKHRKQTIVLFSGLFSFWEICMEINYSLFVSFPFKLTSSVLGVSRNLFCHNR